MKEEIRYIRNCYSCIAFGLCFYFVFLPILMHLAAIVEGLIYNEMYLQRFVGRALGISMWWVYLSVTDVRIVLKEITIWCTCWFKIYQTSRKSWDMDIKSICPDLLLMWHWQGFVAFNLLCLKASIWVRAKFQMWLTIIVSFPRWYLSPVVSFSVSEDEMTKCHFVKVSWLQCVISDFVKSDIQIYWILTHVTVWVMVTKGMLFICCRCKYIPNYILIYRSLEITVENYMKHLFQNS